MWFYHNKVHLQVKPEEVVEIKIDHGHTSFRLFWIGVPVSSTTKSFSN